MITKCKKCGHEWNYKGKSRYYATCPMCRHVNKFTIEQSAEPDGSKVVDSV